MKKLLGSAMVMLLLAGVANADYSFPMFDITNVPDTTVGPAVVDLNGAAITADTYYSYSVTFDWSAVSGDPWSEEALLGFADANSVDGVTTWYADPGTNMPGSYDDPYPTTITQTGFFDTPYVGGNPLFFFAGQAYTGSVASWTDIDIDFSTATAVAPTAMDVAVPSSTSGSLSEGVIDWYSFTLGSEADVDINTLLSPLTTDTELGLYSETGTLLATNDDFDYANDIYLSQILGTLSAGTYYVAVGGWDSQFGNGFTAVGGDSLGDYTLTITPEPASLALLVLGGFSALRRRR